MLVSDHRHPTAQEVPRCPSWDMGVEKANPQILPHKVSGPAPPALQLCGSVSAQRFLPAENWGGILIQCWGEVCSRKDSSWGQLLTAPLPSHPLSTQYFS